MQNALYVSLSAQMSLSRRLETIANNVANMNTIGFRATGVSFAQEVARTGSQKTAFVSPGQDYISTNSGGLVRTDNPLDVAIQGDGWLSVRTPNGVAYTRDGRMRITETGGLETLNGDKILDAGGAAITLDPAGGEARIAEDGMINQDGRQVGALGLFSISSDATLARAGSGAVTADTPATPIVDFTRNRIIQGSIENSNVNPIDEMVKLITVSRNFDAVSSGISQMDSTLQEAIKTLGSNS